MEKEEARNDKRNIGIAVVDSNETLDYIEHGVFGEVKFQQEKIGKKGEGRIVRERKSYRKIGVIKTRSKLF